MKEKRNKILDQIRKETPQEIKGRVSLDANRHICSMELFGVPYQDLGQLGKWEVDDTLKNQNPDK